MQAILRAIIAFGRSLRDIFNRSPVGQILVGLGLLQLLIIAMQQLFDVWDDLIEPLLLAVACNDDDNDIDNITNEG